MSKRILLCLCLQSAFVLAFTAMTLKAQTPQTTPPAQAAPTPTDCEGIKKTLGDNFSEVAEVRDSTNAESVRLDQKIKEMAPQIAKAPAQAELDLKRKEREKLLAKTTRTPEEDLKLLDLNESVDVRSREDLKTELTSLEQQLILKKAQGRCIQQAINSIYSPEQVFKRWMSIIFAGLIGLVIVGFFVLSIKDEAIRRAIFSGQTGIQFLTLFSIVIAIILFGITSILQDKELAALLGGLSGYILGRHSTNDVPKPATPPPGGGQ
jgi:hypothetical protein